MAAAAHAQQTPTQRILSRGRNQLAKYQPHLLPRAELHATVVQKDSRSHTQQKTVITMAMSPAAPNTPLA
jgi:hypothetical protein